MDLSGADTFCETGRGAGVTLSRVILLFRLLLLVVGDGTLFLGRAGI